MIIGSTSNVSDHAGGPMPSYPARDNLAPSQQTPVMRVSLGTGVCELAMPPNLGLLVNWSSTFFSI